MKTTFKQFVIKNGICIADAIVPLDKQGVVFIKGDNQDEGGSEGAGKSALFESLCYVCIGETSKGMRKNELLRLDDPAGLYYGLDVERDTKYKIEHFRNHPPEGTKISVLVGDDKEDRTPKVGKGDRTAAQRFASKCIGFTPRDFYGWVYVRQKFNNIMVNGTPTEKRQYISAYFGLDSLDTLVSCTTKRINSIKLPDESKLLELRDSILEDLKTYDIDKLAKDVADTEQLQKDIHQRLITICSLIDKQREASALVQQREQYEDKLAIYKLSFRDNLEQLIDADLKQVAECAKQKADKIERTKLEQELSDLGARPDLSYEAVNTELEQINQVKNQAEQVLNQVIERNKLEAKLSDIPKWNITQEEITEQIQKLQEELVEPQKQLLIKQTEVEQLRKVNNVCYTCLRPLPEVERNNMIAERMQQLEALITTVATIKEQLTSYNNVAQQIEHRLQLVANMQGLAAGDVDILTTQIHDLTKRRAELSLIVQQILKITEITGKLQHLTQATETLEQLTSIEQELTEQIRVMKQANTWFLKHGGVVFDINEMSRLQTEKNNLDAQYQDLTNQIAQWKEQQATYTNLQKQLDDVTHILSTSSLEKNRARVLDVVHIVLKDVRKMKLRESAEMLTQVLPANIRQLYPRGDVGIEVTDKEGELDLFLRKGRILVPMKNLSGGQSKRVGLAIVSAFAKMGSKQSNLLMLDEPYKDLDPYGRAAAYELFMDLGAETLLITSHDNDVGIESKYSQVWCVQMKNGVSRLYT